MKTAELIIAAVLCHFTVIGFVACGADFGNCLFVKNHLKK
jgi:hypothetical protein